MPCAGLILGGLVSDSPGERVAVGLPLSLTVEPQSPALGVESPPHTRVACWVPHRVLSCPVGALCGFPDRRCLLDLSFCLAVWEAAGPQIVILRANWSYLPWPLRHDCGFSVARRQELD